MRGPLVAAGVALAALSMAASPALGVPAPPGVGAAVANAVSTPCGWATTAPPASYDHVIVVVFENKSWSQVFASGNAPYLTGLAAECGRGDTMQALSNYASLANYIALTSGTLGSPKEITKAGNPSAWPQDSASIFEHLGTQAVQLAESQPTTCALKGAGDFMVGHTPLQYYSRIKNTLCPTQARSLTSPIDLSAKYTLVIPNRCHDMHKCPSQPTLASRVKGGDSWASTFVPTLLASPEYQAGRTAIFLTWDEGISTSFQIPFIVISPYTSAGLKVTTRFDHYSMLKAVQQMLGDSPLLGHAGDATTVSLAPAYGLQ